MAIADGSLPYLILGILSLGVLAATAILVRTRRRIFLRFFGPVHPLLVFLIVVGTGFLLLGYLNFQNWFTIFDAHNLPTLLPLAALASLLVLIMVLVDWRIRFPQDMNVLFPASLLFYPAIGYLVEILFHVLPLTVLLLLLHGVFRSADFETLLWAAMPLTALIEPLYQAAPLVGEPRYPRWAAPAVGLHLFLFNGIQLALFYRYDFVSMYAFRLAYYLGWHIIWGHLRLRLLFPAASAD